MRENDFLTGNRRMKASFLVRCDAEEGGGFSRGEKLLFVVFGVGERWNWSGGMGYARLKIYMRD